MDLGAVLVHLVMKAWCFGVVAGLVPPVTSGVCRVVRGMALAPPVVGVRRSVRGSSGDRIPSSYVPWGADPSGDGDVLDFSKMAARESIFRAGVSSVHQKRIN
ncbi:unnamed protein product [Caretta caretta]